MPLGPAQQYIVTYNGYQLPGYAQSEDDPSEMSIVDHYAFGWDGSLSQVAGLTNKELSMEFKVWEATYQECKNQYHKATAILRSRREGTARLFVDYTDRYFDATVKSVRYNQSVADSRRLLIYSVNFDCLPWMTSTATHTLNGTGTVTTDSVSRDITYGGWTPGRITLTGTNVTVSGYTETGEFAGFVSVSGGVTGLTIDTYRSTSSLGGDTADGYMYYKDYGLWVGPGKTTFVTTGASSFSLSYEDRWY
jgi:hypothetical protein